MIRYIQIVTANNEIRKRLMSCELSVLSQRGLETDIFYS